MEDREEEKKAEIYEQQKIMKRRKQEFADRKSDFCKKLHLATDLANQMVDILATSEPSKVWKCSLQAKQLLQWGFCTTLTAPAWWNQWLMLEKPDEVLGKYIRVTAFLLISEILLYEFLIWPFKAKPNLLFILPQNNGNNNNLCYIVIIIDVTLSLKPTGFRR